MIYSIFAYKGGRGVTIRHLRIMKAVSEEGSMSRAAEKLYMSQPGISHAVADLEEEVGAPLLLRQGRRLRLNEAGRLFMEKADRLLELYDELEKGAQAMVKQTPMRLGSSITIANFQLPSIMQRLEKRCPDILFRVTVDNAHELQKRLMNHELDAALVEGPVQYEQLEGLPYAAYELAVLCAPSHPLAGRGEVSAEELPGERWLLREKGSSNRDLLDSALLLRGLSVEPVWVSVNSQALIWAAEAGLGLTVLPRILVRQELEAGALVRLEVRELSLIGRCHLVTRRGVPSSPALEALREIILDSGEKQG